MRAKDGAGFAARAAACGRLGMGAAEMADALGWSQGELQARSGRWDALEAGRSRAHDAAQGWWEGRSRRWAGAGRPAAGVWSKVMAARFGPGAVRSELVREIDSRERAKAVALLLAQSEAAES